MANATLGHHDAASPSPGSQVPATKRYVKSLAQMSWAFLLTVLLISAIIPTLGLHDRLQHFQVQSTLGTDQSGKPLATFARASLSPTGSTCTGVSPAPAMGRNRQLAGYDPIPHPHRPLVWPGSWLEEIMQKTHEHCRIQLGPHSSSLAGNSTTVSAWTEFPTMFTPESAVSSTTTSVKMLKSYQKLYFSL
jgi:hypothetical protein